MSSSLFGQGYDLTFTIDDLTGEELYLGYHFGEQRFLRDTAIIEDDGRVRFTDEEPLKPGVYFLYSPDYYLEFIGGEPTFQISTSKGGGYKTMEISGSVENQLFKEFQLGMIDIQERNKELTSDLGEASTTEDSTVIYEEIGALDNHASAFRKKIARENPESFVSKLVWLMERPEVPQFDEIVDKTELARTKYLYYRDHYFDNIDISNPDIIRTPIVVKTVNEFLDQVIVQSHDSITSTLDWIIDQVEQDQEAYRFWLVTLFSKYQKSTIMGMDAIMVYLAEKYYLAGKVDWVDEESLTKLADEVDFLKPNLLGNTAPPLKLLDTLMQPMDLREVAADYTILFFYDPDCGHCKKKTPVLLEAYHAIKDESVEVVAVCTVTDIDKWKQYVAKNNLDWINGADPYYKSNFRKEYNVRSTPTIYILDRDKKIIAKKLDVDQLAGFIEKHRERSEAEGDD